MPVFPFTDNEVWKVQQEDAKVYQSILEDGKKMVNSTITLTIIHSDKVYCIVKLSHPTIYQVWIPNSLCARLLSFFHDDPLSGHLGRYKT